MARRAASYGRMLARVVELALSVVVAAALCYTIQGGFNVSDAVHAAVWLDVLASLILQGVLLSGAFVPRYRVASLVGYVAIALVACGIAIAAAPAGNPIADVPQNPFVATALFCVVNLFVFILARRRVTCLALFGLGSFICGCTQFLYSTDMLVATAVFLMTAGMLVAFRSYVNTAREVSSVEMPLLGKASLVGALIPVIACMAAAAIAIGIIMPLDPPHAVIKLFNEYVAYEDDRVKTSVVLDENAEKTLTSSNIDESLEPRTTTNMRTDGDAPRQPPPDNPPQNDKDYLSSDYSDVDLSGLIDNMQSLALNPPIPWRFIVLCAIAAIVALLTLPRFIVHRVRLKRISSKPPGEQVALFYNFFLSRFKKLGLEKPPAASPVEYANQFRKRLAPYVGAQEAGSFDHLTALLVQKEYAGIEPDTQDLESMQWLYRMFYKRCRKELGLFNYCFRRFTL